MSEDQFKKIMASLGRMEKKIDTADKRLGLIEKRLGNIEPWVSTDNSKLLYQPSVNGTSKKAVKAK